MSFEQYTATHQWALEAAIATSLVVEQLIMASARRVKVHQLKDMLAEQNGQLNQNIARV